MQLHKIKTMIRAAQAVSGFACAPYTVTALGEWLPLGFGLRSPAPVPPQT